MGVCGEAERFGVGKAAEGGPGFFGGDAAEFEDLWGRGERGEVRWEECLEGRIGEGELTLESWVTSFLPWRRGSLVRSSPNIQPMLQRSTSGPYLSAPRRSSGARYQRVTTNWVSFGGGSP